RRPRVTRSPRSRGLAAGGSADGVGTVLPTASGREAEPNGDETAIDNPQRIARRSAIVGTGTLVSRLTGVVRVAVTAGVLGKPVLADTYNAANITPNILYELLLGGVLTAALVPVFVDAHDADDETATNAIFTVAMSAVFLLTGIALLLSPVISAA